MSFETWLAYLSICFTILIIPGPTVMLVVGYALGDGRRAALGAVRGVLLGDAVAISLSALGLGALLAASATAFTVLKLVGAFYLVYLGIKLWRAPVNPHGLSVPPAEARHAARDRAIKGFIVTVLNPKGLAFFLAFLPQFMVADAPVAQQVAILTATFVGVAAITKSGYAILAGTVRERLRNPAVLRWINRVGGGFMIGAGALTATMRRVN